MFCLSFLAAEGARARGLAAAIAVVLESAGMLIRNHGAGGVLLLGVWEISSLMP